jgi:hypothetical protein
MRKITVGLVAVALLIVAAVYFLFNPADSYLFPKCPFFLLTGLKCPGCGSQRAIHSLLHLDLAGAAHHNFILLLFIPVILLLLYAYAVKNRRPDFYNKINSRYMILGTFAAILLWWALRNVFGL